MENPKKRRAREAMESVFLDLLKKKPIEKISVKELCVKAEVNRSTFYEHYLDIYDLRDQVADSFVRKMFHEIVEELNEPAIGVIRSSGHPLIIKALQVTMDNRDFCRLLLYNKSGISTSLMHDVIQWCCQRYQTYSDRKNSAYIDNYTMMIGGVMALWYEWIRSDFETPTEQLALEITGFIEGNILRIWQ